MDVKYLKRIKEAPQEGFVLAYFRNRVMFEKYSSVDVLCDQLCGEEILEIHLFDDEREYRALHSISRRFPCGFIETVVSFPYKDNDLECYKYDSLVEIGFNKTARKLSVIHHISYDENGVLILDNYRLA